MGDIMEIINNLLLWLHLTALAAGAVPAFGMPVVGSKMRAATPETRAVLFSIAHGLSSVGRGAFAVLLVTGPLLVWLKFGGVSGLSWWFSLKMLLVLILLIGVIYSGMLLKRAEGGDAGAARLMPRLGGGLMVVYLGVVLSAVFAFN
jgi:putative membrane protein